MEQINSNSVYNTIAPFYDILMSHVPYSKWSNYLDDIFSKKKLKPHTILDMCCGTALFTIFLAAKNYQTCGFDLSEEMIHIGKENVKEFNLDIDLKCQNMASFSYPITFDAVVCFFDSINHLLNESEVSKTFELVYEHLNPGGAFVFDMNTEHAFASGMFNQTYHDPSDILSYEWKSCYNHISKVISVDMIYTFHQEKILTKHYQKYYSTNQICTFLKNCGFKEIDVFESYTFKPPSPFSERVHFVAIK